MTINLKKFINSKIRLLNLIRLSQLFIRQPIFLLLHLTLDCNCFCPACYQRKNDFYQTRNRFIDVDDLGRIFKEAKSFFIKPRIHLFGGEPLLHPEFEKILALIDEAGLKSSLTTNGILLERFADKISFSGLDQINISLDDLEDKHDQLRNFNGCFGRAVRGIKALRDKEVSARRNKIININCLIGENNYFRLTDIVDYFIKNDLGIDLLAFQHSYFNPATQSPRIDLSILGAQMEAVKKIKAPFDLVFIPEIKNKDLKEFYFLEKRSDFKNNCLMPWLGLSVLPNLEATPGGGVLGCNVIIGNLKSAALKEVWGNSAMKEFRKNLVQKKMPPACARCCHRRYY